MRERWRTLLLVVLAIACKGADEERRGPVQRTQQSAVPGVETAVAAVESVRDVVQGFGTVAAAGEPPEVRDARTQLAEAQARQRLAQQQVSRLEALARGAVAPRKELEAAHAEQATAEAAATHARQVLASFGTDAQQRPLAADEAWVIGQVVQPDLGRVEAHAATRFVADAFPNRTFDGQVDAAPAYVDPATRMAPTRLRTRDPEHALRPGMTGAVAIEYGLPRATVFVPATAVVYDGAQAVVFVEDGANRYTPRPVLLGATREGQVEIANGLAAGARVAVTGAASLLSEARLPRSGGEE